MERLNVLITAASRRVPLVRAFQAALQTTSRRGRVIVTDVNPMSPAVHVADRWYHVPLATAPDYIDAIAGICDAEGVGLIVPTIDDELEACWLFDRDVAGLRAFEHLVDVHRDPAHRIAD